MGIPVGMRPPTQQELQEMIRQRKEELNTVKQVRQMKSDSLYLLTTAKQLIENEQDTNGAISLLLEVQRREFALVIAGFDERIQAIENYIKEASSPIVRANRVPQGN